MGTVLVCGSFLFLGTLLFSAGRLLYPGAHDRPAGRKAQPMQNLTEMWRMQSYRRILLSGLLRTPSGLMNLLQMTVLSYYFGNNGRTPYVHYMLLLGIPAFLGQLIAAGAAPKLADKHGAATTFAQANVFAGLALLAAFALFLCRPQQLTQALPFTLLILLLFCNMFCCGLVNTVQSILIGRRSRPNGERKRHTPGRHFCVRAILTHQAVHRCVCFAARAGVFDQWL